MERNPKSLLSDLINMVMADGKIKPSEIDFIQKLARRMEISDKELVDLFENPQPSSPVFNEVERITHFYKLILMMNVDNETHESEIVALKNFGLRMGIRPIVADQILKKMDESEEKMVPAEELLKIFKIYYN
jgi:uncharacterized tellurite resistance protein B-like protein